MRKYVVHPEFKAMCITTSILAFSVLTFSLLVFFLLPENISATAVFSTDNTAISEKENLVEISFSDLLTEKKSNHEIEKEKGLMLYRNPVSRSTVEWFYMHITNNRDVTLAILKEADRNDIPLSLAFALAHEESRYNIKAVNYNANNTVDRGLFQLNSSSFPGLMKEDFFDSYENARYGLSHLKFCLNTAGNEVTALAMYNAGTNKVRKNSTPQRTLNYVNEILTYQESLNDLFDSEVASFYEDSVDAENAVILAKN